MDSAETILENIKYQRLYNHKDKAQLHSNQNPNSIQIHKHDPDSHLAKELAQEIEQQTRTHSSTTTSTVDVDINRMNNIENALKTYRMYCYNPGRFYRIFTNQRKLLDDALVPTHVDIGGDDEYVQELRQKYAKQQKYRICCVSILGSLYTFFGLIVLIGIISHIKYARDFCTNPDAETLLHHSELLTFSQCNKPLYPITLFDDLNDIPCNCQILVIERVTTAQKMCLIHPLFKIYLQISSCWNILKSNHLLIMILIRILPFHGQITRSMLGIFDQLSLYDIIYDISHNSRICKYLIY